MDAAVSLPPCCFANEAAQLWLQPLGFVQTVWLPGSASSSALRVVFEQVLLHLTQQGWQKALVDQRQLAPLSPEDTSWLLLDWLPRATQQAYRYGAIVNSPQVLTRVATHTIRQQAMQHFPLVYRHFEQEALAIDWLLAQP